jgi:alkylation response protein AidB-like acyl-CoA dehydrogenase
LSEPEAGSDVGAIATSARRDGEHFGLDGTKTWISNGGLASYYVVFARSETAPGTKGLSAFVVDADAPGFRVAQEIEVVAPHPLARLSFEGCRVPRSRLVGEPGRASRSRWPLSTFSRERRRRRSASLRRPRRVARARRVPEQFGKKLGDFQIVQAKLADMATSSTPRRSSSTGQPG